MVIGQCDLIVERERAYSLVCGVPKSKPRFHLFTFGRAEVRVAFNDRAERYHSRNLVTERDATGELALLGGECGVSRTNSERPSNGMEGAASA